RGGAGVAGGTRRGRRSALERLREWEPARGRTACGGRGDRDAKRARLPRGAAQGVRTGGAGGGAGCRRVGAMSRRKCNVGIVLEPAPAFAGKRAPQGFANKRWARQDSNLRPMDYESLISPRRRATTGAKQAKSGQFEGWPRLRATVAASFCWSSVGVFRA